MFSATAIARSKTEDGRLVETYRLRYPKFIHGEFMTHRVFSRNASSSRAIPVARMVEEAMGADLRAEPVWWGKNQPGMGADVELEGAARDEVKMLWASAARTAALFAKDMAAAGAHKQIVNRILEPFVHINVVVTSASLENFFGLRLDRAAQPEMRTLAECVWEASYRAPPPEELVPGQWHLPYVDQATVAELIPIAASDDHLELQKRVSVARCARVSYESFATGKKSTVKEDLALCQSLMASGHWSPFEHQCSPDWLNRGGELGRYQNANLHGNLPGWIQYRKTFPGEDVRPLPEEYR